MNIAIVGYGIAPEVLAGTEWATYYIAKNLVKRGHHVEVFITTTRRDQPLEEEREGFTIRRIVATRLPILKTLQFVCKGTRVVVRSQPDIVHGQAILPGGLIAVLAGRRLRRPSIVYVQGRDYLLRSWKLKPFVRFVLKHASQVLTTTAFLTRQIREDIGCVTPYVIPNGVEIPATAVMQEERCGDCQKILYAGRLVKEKGVEHLLMAFDRICRDRPNTQLYIVGDGADRVRLESMGSPFSAKKVFFVGTQPQSEVFRYMRECDIFVLPSTFEPFGTVLIEAMSMGLPIVATQIMGISETVIDGENGLLVAPESVDGLHQALCFLLDRADVRADMGRRNYEKALSYSWENCASRLEGLYSECRGMSGR